MIPINIINLIFYAPFLIVVSSIVILPFHLILKYGFRKYTKIEKRWLILFQLFIAFLITRYEPSSESIMKDEFYCTNINQFKDLKTSVINIGECTYTYVHFNGNIESINHLIKKMENGERLLPFKSHNNRFSPKWWNPKQTNDSQFYKQMEDQEFINILYNPSKNEIYIKRTQI